MTEQKNEVICSDCGRYESECICLQMRGLVAQPVTSAPLTVSKYEDWLDAIANRNNLHFQPAPLTDEELVEKIAKWAVQSPYFLLGSVNSVKNVTAEILSLIHSAGYVKLDKDQKLPDDSDFDQYVTKDWNKMLLTPTDNGDGTESVWVKIRRG